SKMMNRTFGRAGASAAKALPPIDAKIAAMKSNAVQRRHEVLARMGDFRRERWEERRWIMRWRRSGRQETTPLRWLEIVQRPKLTTAARSSAALAQIAPAVRPSTKSADQIFRRLSQFRPPPLRRSRHGERAARRKAC